MFVKRGDILLVSDGGYIRVLNPFWPKGPEPFCERVDDDEVPDELRPAHRYSVAEFGSVWEVLIDGESFHTRAGGRILRQTEAQAIRIAELLNDGGTVAS